MPLFFYAVVFRKIKILQLRYSRRLRSEYNDAGWCFTQNNNCIKVPSNFFHSSRIHGRLASGFYFPNQRKMQPSVENAAQGTLKHYIKLNCYVVVCCIKITDLT